MAPTEVNSSAALLRDSLWTSSTQFSTSRAATASVEAYARRFGDDLVVVNTLAAVGESLSRCQSAREQRLGRFHEGPCLVQVRVCGHAAESFSVEVAIRPGYRVARTTSDHGRLVFRQWASAHPGQRFPVASYSARRGACSEHGP